MFYGAGIWLVAQVYHIDEHYPNGFLFWALGALVLAWALESIPQALLATVLFTIWAAPRRGRSTAPLTGRRPCSPASARWRGARSPGC